MKRRLEKGYTKPAAVTEFVKSCKATDPLRAVACALADHSIILLAASTGYALYRATAAWAWLPAHAVIFACIARCQRGLECLVHEGSHYNWTRNHKLNDRLVDLLAALPVFSRVASFRGGHTPHHVQFGSETDTDLKRYRQLDIGRLDRSGLAAYLAGARRRFGAYAASWWRAIGHNAVTLRAGLAWHLVAIVLPLSLAMDAASATALWAVYWVLPMMVALPMLRFVAESGEHDYEGGPTEFEATISNIGFFHQFFFHPHGDGFHVLHHMEPCIPFYQLRRAHRGLMALDPEGYGARHRARTSILQEPKAGPAPALDPRHA